MATIKSFTSVEQSKELAEILPLESADMRYHTISHYNPYPCDEIVYTVEFGKASGIDIPCWSLAALLELIRNFQPNNQSALFVGKEDGYQYMSSVYLATQEYNNPVDVCYVMILKLHELKLL